MAAFQGGSGGSGGVGDGRRMEAEAEAQKLSAVVSELELLLHTSAIRPPDPLFCFDLLKNLHLSIEHEPGESLQLMQRRTEDTLQGLLLQSPGGPPVRRLIALALVRVIERGDTISVYSRVRTLQSCFFEKGDKKVSAYLGALEGLGALTSHFGQHIASSLSDTVSVVAKLLRHSELPVRHAAAQLLLKAIEAMAGAGPTTAYSDAVRALTGHAARDRSPLVRETAAHCIRALVMSGGPGLGGGGLDSLAQLCVKSLEDQSQAARDAFAAALGCTVALGLNPQAQVLPRGKGPVVPARAMDSAIQKYLTTPFARVSVSKSKEVRIGIAMAWTAFLHAMRQHYGLNDMDLLPYGIQALNLLAGNSRSLDSQAQASVLYLLQAGIVEQMGEEAQRAFAEALTKQLTSADMSPHMLAAALRTLSLLLRTLGEVTQETRAALDYGLLATLSSPSPAVRVEASLTIRALALVDASRAHSFILSGFTALRALRETINTEKAERLKTTLDAMQGQSLMLSALLVLGPRLPLGLPSSLSLSILDIAQQMVLTPGQLGTAGASIAAVEHEAGWLLIGALVLSMPKEEVMEREVEFIALWTIPFGGNCAERVKQLPSSSLPAELSCWSAAMDALKAFIQSHVVPNLSSSRRDHLLNPMLAYLQGALAYLQSPALADASGVVKAHAELFASKVLTTFLAFPDPELYRALHPMLIDLCTAPFRENASGYAASSLLHELLDPSDASLGPWIPGRDMLEDELRLVESGGEGVLPVVWEESDAAFPQSVALSTVLVDSMLRLFIVLFPVQSVLSRLAQADTLLVAVRAGKNKAWRNNVTTNACVTVLGCLKAAVGKRPKEEDGEVWKKVQMLVQNILAADPSNPAFSRTSAEALGLLARIGDDVAAARLLRSLIVDCDACKDPAQKAAIALAFGCVLRSVGGIALSSMVPSVVQQLLGMARVAGEGQAALSHIWALHALWLTADAAGLSYTPHVKATLSMLMDVLLSDEHMAPGLFQSIGRVVNALVAVFGPEFVPGSTVFYRCKCIVDDISSCSDPAAQLECVLYTQQLVLFAPNALPLHEHVATLRATLSSRQPALRHAAVSTLRHMSEREPAAMVEQRIEEDLFAMLDNETDSRIVKIVCMTLERLLEAACPYQPSRWLRLCKNVVLAAAATKRAGEDSSADAAAAGQEGTDNDEAEMVSGAGASTVAGTGTAAGSGGGGAGGGSGAAGGGGGGASMKASESNSVEQLPRFRTRMFAAQCLSRLPEAAGSNPAHFDLELAREEKLRRPDSDWLVLHVGDLVALAFQVGTGTMESIRPMGVTLLGTILDKYGNVADPEFEGHLLLEQYQAQFLSTIRTTLESVANPLLMVAGAQLSDQVVRGRLGTADLSLVQRVLGLLASPLLKWEVLSNPSYADWVGFKVKLELLVRQARLKSDLITGLTWVDEVDVAEADKAGGAYSGRGRASSSSSRASRAGVEDRRRGRRSSSKLGPLQQFERSPEVLTKYWIGFLRDCTAAFALSDSLALYQPTVSSELSAALLATARPLMAPSWPIVLDAVTRGISPKLPLPPPPQVAAGGTAGADQAQAQGAGGSVDAAEFAHLWAACMFSLLEDTSAEAAALPPPLPVSGPLLSGRQSSAASALSRMSTSGGSTAGRVSDDTSAEGGAAVPWTALDGREGRMPAWGWVEVGEEERKRLAVDALGRLCAPEFFAPSFNSPELCCELLQALTRMAMAGQPLMRKKALTLAQQLSTHAPEEVLSDAGVAAALSAVPLALMHTALEHLQRECGVSSDGSSDAGVSTIDDSRVSPHTAELTLALRVMEVVPARMNIEAQALVLPTALCAVLRLLAELPAEPLQPQSVFSATRTSATPATAHSTHDTPNDDAAAVMAANGAAADASEEKAEGEDGEEDEWGSPKGAAADAHEAQAVLVGSVGARASAAVAAVLSAAAASALAQTLQDSGKCAVALSVFGSSADAAASTSEMSAGWAGQRSSVVSSVVDTLARLVEKSAGWRKRKHGGSSGRERASLVMPQGESGGSGLAPMAEGQEGSSAALEPGLYGSANAVDGRGRSAEAGALGPDPGNGDVTTDSAKGGGDDDDDFDDFMGASFQSAAPAVSAVFEPNGVAAARDVSASMWSSEGEDAVGADGSEDEGDEGDEGTNWQERSAAWCGSSARIAAAMTALAQVPPLVAKAGGDYFAMQLAESSKERCLHCFRLLFAAANAKLRMVAVNALKTLLQTAASASAEAAKAEHADEKDRSRQRAAARTWMHWALQCVAIFAADVCGVVHSFALEQAKGQNQSTAEAAADVMECLKLLLLLHSALEDDAAQQAVLELLLPTAIAATSAVQQEHSLVPGAPQQQAEAALTGMTVKLVTHFAAVFPSQLQAATAALHPDSKAQLQAIIRSAVTSQQQAQQQPAPPTAATAVRASGGVGSPSLLPAPPAPSSLRQQGTAVPPHQLPPLSLPRPSGALPLLPLPKPSVGVSSSGSSAVPPPPIAAASSLSQAASSQTSASAKESVSSEAPQLKEGLVEDSDDDFEDDEWAEFASHRSSEASASAVTSASASAATHSATASARPSSAAAASDVGDGRASAGVSGSTRESTGSWSGGAVGGAEADGDDNDDGWSAFGSASAAGSDAARESSAGRRDSVESTGASSAQLGEVEEAPAVQHFEDGEWDDFQSVHKASESGRRENSAPARSTDATEMSVSETGTSVSMQGGEGADGRQSTADDDSAVLSSTGGAVVEEASAPTGVASGTGTNDRSSSDSFVGGKVQTASEHRASADALVASATDQVTNENAVEERGLKPSIDNSSVQQSEVEGSRSAAEVEQSQDSTSPGFERAGQGQEHEADVSAEAEVTGNSLQEDDDDWDSFQSIAAVTTDSAASAALSGATAGDAGVAVSGWTVGPPPPALAGNGGEDLMMDIDLDGSTPH